MFSSRITKCALVAATSLAVVYTNENEDEYDEAALMEELDFLDLEVLLD